mgnify:CR=1 FL=1
MARKARPDRARLTRGDVVEIRKQVSEGESQSDLARHFKVSRNTIFNIVHRNTWRHVE